jgi:hypothetical protein
LPPYYFGSYLDSHQPLVLIRVPGNLDSVSAHILKIANFFAMRGRPVPLRQPAAIEADPRFRLMPAFSGTLLV